jgi:hypothetical protein
LGVPSPSIPLVASQDVPLIASIPTAISIAHSASFEDPSEGSLKSEIRISQKTRSQSAFEFLEICVERSILVAHQKTGASVNLCKVWSSFKKTTTKIVFNSLINSLIARGLYRHPTPRMNTIQFIGTDEQLRQRLVFVTHQRVQMRRQQNSQ